MIQLASFGLDFIKRWEGCERLNKSLGLYFSYLDPINLPTIGIGHLIKSGESFAKGLTLDQVLSLLQIDVAPCMQAIEDLLPLLTDHQAAALASWMFNVGWHALAKSGVRKAILDGRMADVPAELKKWCKAGGAINQGLLNRRISEGQMWLKPDVDLSITCSGMNGECRGLVVEEINADEVQAMVALTIQQETWEAMERDRREAREKAFE